MNYDIKKLIVDIKEHPWIESYLDGSIVVLRGSSSSKSSLREAQCLILATLSYGVLVELKWMYHHWNCIEVMEDSNGCIKFHNKFKITHLELGKQIGWVTKKRMPNVATIQGFPFKRKMHVTQGNRLSNITPIFANGFVPVSPSCIFF